MEYKIIFFGTSKFACPALNAIHKKHKLLAVVTSPKNSPIRLLAGQLGIKIFTPENPNSEDFLSALKSLRPDFICLAAYGYILGSPLLKLPKFGAINLHPSLLPAYRGAAPIQWAIIRGEKFTGITTFLMNEKIDQGGILLQKKVKIGDTETYEELEEKLSKIGAVLFLETINKFHALKPLPQSGENISYAPKITKELRRIDWHKSASEIVNLIRALSPKPLAYTIFRGKRLELLRAGVRLRRTDLSGQAGRIECVDRTILVGTVERCVELKVLKPEGKREQTSVDFVNGYRPKVGELME